MTKKPLDFAPPRLLVVSRTKVTLEGLDECVVPVEPESTNYRIQVPVSGKMIQRTVPRRQFPLTAAYTFTEYRLQGQMTSAVR